MMREMRRRGYKSMGTTRLLDHLSKGELLRRMPALVIGAEGEDDGDKGGNDNKGGDGSGNGDGDEGDGDDDDDAEGDKDKDTTGLKSALAKERAAAKAAQRELAKLKKAADDADLAKKSDIEQAQARELAATEKVQKLANGLLQDRLNAAITKAANTAKFIDADDAINGIDRGTLTFEQDADDPSNITIDAKTVERAVKALAAKKPHFLVSGTDDGEPTGGRFGGSKGGGKKPTDEDVLKSRYPALQ